MTPILNYTPVCGTPDFELPIEGLPPCGYDCYWDFITRLTGGVLATDLDAQNIAAVPLRGMVEVVIAGRGESTWRKTEDATSPVSDTEAGIVTPISYNVSTNPYVWKRTEGY